MDRGVDHQHVGVDHRHIAHVPRWRGSRRNCCVNILFLGPASLLHGGSLASCRAVGTGAPWPSVNDYGERFGAAWACSSFGVLPCDSPQCSHLTGMLPSVLVALGAVQLEAEFFGFEDVAVACGKLSEFSSALERQVLEHDVAPCEHSIDATQYVARRLLRQGWLRAVDVVPYRVRLRKLP